MVIHVKDHLSGCATNEDGETLLTLVDEEIRDHGMAHVDFHGVIYVTTSFVNSAFLPLLDRMSFDEAKARLKVTGALPQIADMVRRRMADAASRIAA